MTGRTRRLLPALILASLLALAGPAAWPQGTLAGASSSSSGDQVVAAWTITQGTARPDPAVSVAASGRRQYDLVEAYVWNALPPDARSRVSRLELFVSRGSADDAPDGTATENDDGVTWTLALDWQEGKSAVIGGKADDRAVFDEVIAHEVGHVLSLNETQRAGDDEDPGYSDQDGSFTVNAYLSKFYRWFWRSLWPLGEQPGSRDSAGQASAGQASARYDEDPDAFVTEYAATSPSEDFAESFASFVLGPAPHGYTVKDRKIRFFYGYPELVADREYLRKGLSSSK